MNSSVFIRSIVFVTLVLVPAAIFAQDVKTTSTSAESELQPAQAKTPKTRSKWAIFGGIGFGLELDRPYAAFSISENNPSKVLKYSMFHFYKFTIPVRVGVTYYLMESCQKNTSSSCVDFFVSGMIQYQFLSQYQFNVPLSDTQTSSIFIVPSLGGDIYFGPQRKLAWTIKIGIGYAHFSYNNLITSDAGTSYYYAGENQVGFDIASALQNRLVISISSGVLWNIPSVPGLGLYAQLEFVPTMILAPIATYTTLQFVLPMVGLNYRF